MTNFERWKDEILRMSKESKILAFRKKYPDAPVECSDIDSCRDCLFDPGKEYRHCINRMFFWLYDEYIKPIKLTHKQLEILKILETGWLARDDSSDILYWYSERPKRVNWHFETVSASGKSMSVRGIFDAFDFITFKDEPFSVEEMLKWEVVND